MASSVVLRAAWAWLLLSVTPVRISVWRPGLAPLTQDTAGRTGSHWQCKHHHQKILSFRRIPLKRVAWTNLAPLPIMLLGGGGSAVSNVTLDKPVVTAWPLHSEITVHCTVHTHSTHHYGHVGNRARYHKMIWLTYHNWTYIVCTMLLMKWNDHDVSQDNNNSHKLLTCISYNIHHMPYAMCDYTHSHYVMSLQSLVKSLILKLWFSRILLRIFLHQWCKSELCNELNVSR